MLIRTLKIVSWTLARGAMLLFFFFVVGATTRAQSWSWTYEMVDLPATFPSLVLDASSNLHISYADNNGALKYGFRPAGSTHWFTMVLDRQLGAFTTRLSLDAQNNPYICYTPGVIKLARWDGRQWQIQQIAKNTGQIAFTCSIAIGKDGTPHLTWYQMTDPSGGYLHIRYAVLKENAWLIRTLDFDRETGKWSSMVLDARDNPIVSYSVWVDGELRVAHWDGKRWGFTTIDSRTRNRGEYNIGQGNAIILDADGKAHISFYSDKALKYAYETKDGWKTEIVDQVSWLGSWAQFRSSIALDKQGFPHICYEDTGMLKHAYWDGKQWHIQLLSHTGLEIFRYSTMVMDGNDTIYIAYRDPEDNTLKLATGRLTSGQQNMASKKEEKQEPPPDKN